MIDIAGFHVAYIQFRRFTVGQTILGDNYVLVIAALVPMVSPLGVKAPIKLLGYYPKLAEGSSIIIGQITLCFLMVILISHFPFVQFLLGLSERGGERQRGWYR